MLKLFASATGASLALALLTAPAAAQEATCELDRPIVFAGLDWDSNAFHTAVAQFIAEHGYGCDVDQIPGSTIPLLNGMIRGDIDVTMEMWVENVKEAWEEAEAEGKVVNLGVNFPDAVQAWFIPKYVQAENPGLKRVSDLPEYKEVFADPEQPSKGRFYNGIAGWAAEVINTKKLHAYDLNEHYTNFRPGTGAALSAAIESNLKREKPIFFYYWGPTWVLGKFQDQIVQLEEPEFDQEIWNRMMEQERPEQATEYPLVKVYVTANSEFAQAAPEFSEFLKNYETSNAMVSKALAYMQETGGTAEDAAIDFLQNNEEVWTQWVADAVAENVKAALPQS